MKTAQKRNRRVAITISVMIIVIGVIEGTVYAVSNEYSAQVEKKVASGANTQKEYAVVVETPKMRDKGSERSYTGIVKASEAVITFIPGRWSIDAGQR